jgi:hypothetical protein
LAARLDARKRLHGQLCGGRRTLGLFRGCGDLGRRLIASRIRLDRRGLGAGSGLLEGGLHNRHGIFDSRPGQVLAGRRTTVGGDGRGLLRLIPKE